MRRNFIFVMYLALLSLLSGWLMSKMSWLGRVGIRFMHKEYTFLKTWYEGAAAVFVLLLVFFLIQALVQRALPQSGRRATHIIALLIAGVGLYFTYKDFRTDITHSLLKERFHLGAYLFWIGWMSISLFFLSSKTGRR